MRISDWSSDVCSSDLVAGAKTSWKTDLSGGIQRVAIKHGCAPFGNAKARCVVWTFPDPVPLHREPIYTPRRDLVDKYATYDDRKSYRLPVLFKSIQQQDFSVRSEEHTSELQSLMRISYAVFCLTQKKENT